VSVLRKVARNVGALALARGVSMALGLATTIYLARVLEPAFYGIIGCSTALISYFSLFVALGFDTLGTREVARDHGRVPQLASYILGMRLALACVVALIYLVVVALLPKPGIFKMVLLVQGLSLFAHVFALEWVYMGVERMGVLVVRNIVAAAMTLAGVLLLVHRPEDVVLATLVTVGGLFVGNVWLFFTYRRDFGRLRPRYDRAQWIALIRPAIPIAASLFMIAIYYSMDQVMLGLMATEQEVGWYTAAYKLLFAALVPAQILNHAFLPTLSSAFGNMGAMRERSRQFVGIMMALGIPATVAGVVLAPALIQTVYGAAFGPAAPALALLMVNIALVYFNTALGTPLLAWDRQRPYMIAIGAGAVTNIILNLTLIPSYGIIGASFATVMAELAVLVGLAGLYYRAVGQLHVVSLARISLVTAIGIGPFALAHLMLGWPLVPVALGMGVLYAGAALAFGVVSPSRVRSLLRSDSFPA
jgi:O-antigen/teichoic acid export membrane protein